MKLEPFAMERWQSTYENTVEYNLSESGVHPLAVHELVGDGALADRLLATELGYSQSNGTPELRRAIARLYAGAGEDNVLVSNGSAEAICAAVWSLIEPDFCPTHDHAKDIVEIMRDSASQSANRLELF